MLFSRRIPRRKFLQSTSIASVGALAPGPWFSHVFAGAPVSRPLEQFGYGDVAFVAGLHDKQLQETHSALMELSEDSLLKPIRQMVGQPAPGEDLGGWYHYDPDYDSHPGDVGFAPACPFGQWVSALARMYAITSSLQTREKVLRLNRLYAQTISGDFYENNRFPAYCYDKLVCGPIDSHQFAGDPDAFAILDHTTDTALPHFPGKAVEHGEGGAKIRQMSIPGTSPTRFRKIYLSPINAAPASGIVHSGLSISTMSTTIPWRKAMTCLQGGTLTATSIPCVRRCRPISRWEARNICARPRTLSRC